MKVSAAFVVVSALSQVWASLVRYGPDDCVTLSLSPAGSCVIRTNCEGKDLSHFEFAFDCANSGNAIQRHSFGLGGFDAQEEFDTDVHCKRCAAPEQAKKAAAPPHSFALQGKKVVAQGQASTGVEAAAGAAGDEEVVRYGPSKCVSTYKSPQGHCMMETACSKANVTDYEFGLICVDKAGAPTRHLFGKNSFDPDERFDTLIECDQCLGLEDIADDVALTGQVVALSKDIKDLKNMMVNITTDVMKLNEKVFPDQFKKNGTAPAAAPAPKTLIHTASSRATASQAAQRHGRQVRRMDARFGAAKAAASQTTNVAAKQVAHLQHHRSRHHGHKRAKHLRRHHRHHRHHSVAADDEADEQVADEEEAPPKHHHASHKHHKKATHKTDVEEDGEEPAKASEVSAAPVDMETSQADEAGEVSSPEDEVGQDGAPEDALPAAEYTDGAEADEEEN